MPVGAARAGIFGSGSGSAIPETGLYHHFDAQELNLSDGETVSSWPDESGNGFDLTTSGGPTYQTNQLNGKAGVLFDGTDDVASHTQSVSVSLPYEVWMVAEQLETGQDFMAVNNSGDSGAGKLQTASGNFRLFNGSDLADGAEDTSPHLFGAQPDGTDSFIEVDESQTTGDAGTRSWDTDFYLGVDYFQGISAYGHVRIYEILVYDQDTSGYRQDIRDYLNGEYGL